jgi:hypothetical protein
MKSQTARIAMALLLAAALSTPACTRVAGHYLALSPREYRVTAEKDVMISMRDGTKLAADIYRPQGVSGPLPVVLCRTPYGKGPMSLLGKLLAQRGYIFAVQDCRATGKSEGEVFVPIVNEHDDGMDTVAWIAKQPWFNGQLGAWGPSYLGITQWALAADNPFLKGWYPQITTGRGDRLTFSGGAFMYRLATGWSSTTGKQNQGKKAAEVKGEAGLYNAPLQPALNVSYEDTARLSMSEIAVKAGLAESAQKVSADAADKMIELMSYPGFALSSDAFNFKDRYRQVTAPALMVAGWYDIFLAGQLDDFVAMRRTAPGDAGRYTRIIIGPWGHVTGKHPEAGKDAGIGVMIKDFMVFDWFDRWLRGEDNGVEQEAPILLYVIGKNEWRREQEWPLARTKYTDYYLHSNGQANRRAGDGAISTVAPQEESTDKFVYDPLNPVPTHGGNNLLESVGALDQKKIEERPDVLVYTTPALTEAVEATGPITVTLYAASSTRDTDFTAKLCDVYPDGRSLNLADGIIRARYRESLTAPSLIEPGKIYEYRIDLWATSNLFRQGHKIRVQVSSSNFPRFDRNANAGGEGGKNNVLKAEQTIYHDAAHPSHITLPVIP